MVGAMLACGWHNVGVQLGQRWLIIVGETLAYSWFCVGLSLAQRWVMDGTLLGFGWRIVGSWLAECCFMVGGLCWANVYPTSKVTLAQPNMLLLGQH